MTTSSEKPTLWQSILSVLAAMFGVQSAKTRERDFTHGNPLVFIGLGIVAVVLFVFALYGVVQWVLYTQ